MTAGIGAKLLFSSQNYADSGTYSENNVSPQEWSDALSLNNLKDRQLTKVARSLTLSPDFIVDLGRNQTITFFALLAHNLTISGQWRIIVSRDSDFSTEEYNSGFVDIWPTTQTIGSLPWGGFAWNGKAQSDDANKGILILSSAVFGRYILVSLSDATNSAGYLQAGRFIVDSPWRPTYSVQYGWGVGFSQRSRKVRSRGGQVWGDEQAEYRTLSFNLAGIGEDEIYGQAYEIDRRRGSLGDVLAIIDPSDLANRHKYTIYGTQATLGPTTHRTHKDFSHPFVIEESL